VGTCECSNEPSMGFYLFLVPCLGGFVMDGLLLKYCRCNTELNQKTKFKRDEVFCLPNDVITTSRF